MGDQSLRVPFPVGRTRTVIARNRDSGDAASSPRIGAKRRETSPNRPRLTGVNIQIRNKHGKSAGHAKELPLGSRNPGRQLEPGPYRRDLCQSDDIQQSVAVYPQSQLGRVLSWTCPEPVEGALGLCCPEPVEGLSKQPVLSSSKDRRAVEATCPVLSSSKDHRRIEGRSRMDFFSPEPLQQPALS